MAKPEELFDILGLLPTASLEEVKIAHAVLVKVLRPDRFPEDRIRSEVLRKREEIESAYLKVKSFLESGAEGGGLQKRKTARKNGGKEDNAAPVPSICLLCPKTSIAREPRYSIYCPSCGVLNYLENRTDYYKGSCAECGSPFRVAAPLDSVMRIGVYGVFVAALLSLGALMFFVYGGQNLNSRHRRFPLPQGNVSGKVSVKKFPLPPASFPVVKPAPPAPKVLPQAAPPPETAPAPPPPQAAPGQQPPPPPQNPGQKTENLVPNQTPAKFNERNDELIKRVLKEKSSSPREKTGGLLDIPLPASADENR
ncbi:MAG: J domain-containing protein [Syntrophobacteraceae bacterium]|nr:J domain-containing protein [Syntrophobacteraceae bacterium]